MEATDILFDGDISIEDGDLAIGASDQQHIEHIFRAVPGQFYQWPTLGVGIGRYEHGPINKAKIEQDIRKQLQSDNYRVDAVEIDGSVDELLTTVDATRKA